MLNASRLAGLVALGGLLLGVLALPVPASAQQAITIASLQIGIWPEYDRPSSLVILDGQLAANVKLPAQVNIHMPASAKTPNAVAVAGTDGSLLTAAYTTEASGGDIIIKFTANSAVFRVEYYDPGLTVSGDARSYSFRWQSDYAIGSVSLKVQEPAGARDLKGQPALTSAGAGTDGLNYYTASLGALAPGGLVSLDLTYSKTGSELSATAIGPAQSSGAPVSTPAAANGLAGNLPLILGSAALGLVLVGGGVTWYMRNNRPSRGSARGRRPASPARQATRPPAVPGRTSLAATERPQRPSEALVPQGAQTATKEAATATLNDAPAGFCTRCGQRHQPGDRFCRRCGAPVRE